MPNNSINDEVLALRKSGGYCRQDDYAVIEISGKDAAQFLQARLSNDVLALQPGQGQRTCLLDRKAYVLACALLYRLDDIYWLVTSASRQQRVLELLREFHFREHVQFKCLDKLRFFSLHGSKTVLFIDRARSVCPETSQIASVSIGDAPATLIRYSPTGETGAIIAHTGEAGFLEETAKALNMVPVSNEAVQVAAVEAGELELDLENILLPEAGLESSCVSYTKGCFPGQEVLARIKTYGAPRRGIAGLVLTGNGCEKLTRDAAFNIAGAEAGVVYRACFSPTLKQWLAIVFVNREFRVPDEQFELEIAGAKLTATVRTLPFYSAADKQARAKALYDAALQEFASGSERKASEMLRDVIELNPTMGDAYETLGVILSRQDELDEAIILMKQLAQLDRDSIMAHANLSVFYMQKGDKEAAEEEKALAMSIRMNQMARDVAAEQREKEERQKLKEAAQERMEMFRQVLAIDPDDFLANAGLGSVYVDLEQYEQAISHLQKALEIRPNHTVAYVALGEAFEKIGKESEAIETYKRGVIVAAQRGDGTPLKKMQIRLEKLGAPAGK